VSRPRAPTGWFGKLAHGLGGLLVAGVVALLAIALLFSGFSSLREMRQLERTPRSLAAAVLPGEVHLSGRAQAVDEVLTAPDSGADTLYYSYLVEREERDSDGDTRWVTVSSDSRYVAFELQDESGAILIEPGSAEFDVPNRHQRYEGKLRYTEYRLDPGDEAFVFGYIDERSDPAIVRFDLPGQYSPMISTAGEAEARAGMAAATLFLLWLGLLFLSAAAYALLWGLRVHVSTVFLAVLSLSMAVSMVLLSLQAAEDDLTASYARTARDVAAAENRVTELLQASGNDWDGDWNSLDSRRLRGLSDDERTVVEHLRERMSLQVERTEAVRRLLPERWVAWTLTLPELAPIEPAEPLEDDGRPRPSREAGTRTMPLLSNAFALLGLLAATVFAWFGFRSVRLKRTIENLPTSRTAGAAWGLVELKGKVEPCGATAAFVGPLSGRPCVWYHYTVKERRGSGKNARWVTIEDRRVDGRFLLVDSEGRLPVESAGSEAIVTCNRSRSEGNRRYHERWIEPGTELYALGSARVDPSTGDTLQLQTADGDGGQPFLLSDLTEPELMLRKARKAFLLLMFGVNSGNAAALALLGGAGALHGAGFLFAALAPLGFFAVFLAIVMYNDLVTLRQRVRLTWANIDVSLTKRADLVPALEQVLKSYLGHEQDLQRALAELRRLSSQSARDPAAARDMVSAERTLISGLTMLRERYPELESSEMAMNLATTLVRLDNEVALMREGYNNAVERYNTRRQHFPEVLFAKAFHFGPVGLFEAAPQALQVPSVSIAAGQPG